jgi:hypothetical protein
MCVRTDTHTRNKNEWQERIIPRGFYLLTHTDTA